MKVLRINEDLHAKIKYLAEEQRRTINVMAEMLLEQAIDAPIDGTPTVKQGGAQNTSVSNLPDEMQESITCPKCGMTSYNKNDIKNLYCANCNEYHAMPPSLGITTRTVGEIMNEINTLSDARDEELEYCQDREEYARIEKQYQARIQTLWNEYHEVKG